MKAIVHTSYGPPELLQLKEVDKPSPQDDEVLIKVYASSVNARDWRLMRANPFFIRMMTGFFKPGKTVLGNDFAGKVEAVGRNIRQFQAGDEVFGYLSKDQSSTFAEYVCAKENEIDYKPANLTFEQAAAVPLAAITALQGLRNKGCIQPGQKVLIQGASGGVGMFAVQLAKVFGAEVTAVCSTRNVEMVRSLGADHVIDYKKEDFRNNGQRYDLILAVNGHNPISYYLQSLTPGGTYVFIGGSMRQFIQASIQSRRAGRPGKPKVHILTLVHDPKDLTFLKELLESRKLVTVIDRAFPLGKTAEAIHYVEDIHPKGKVVITIPDTSGG